jgi:holo-[acyl-carrier protein] synthase
MLRHGAVPSCDVVGRTAPSSGATGFSTLWCVDVRGIGVDVAELGRIEGVLSRQARFVERVFTEEEAAYCESRGVGRAACYAGRWAAKEACIKALGGIPGWRWHDMRVIRARSGAPEIWLDGAARRRAEALGVDRVLVTISHERSVAVALCLAMGPGA